jgi:hypothetical protein
MMSPHLSVPTGLVCAGLLALATACTAAEVPAPTVADAPFARLAEVDVVWSEPGAGPADSMPLGNGDIALNAWTDASGDVLFYIAKTDAWGERGDLLKLGRVRIRITPSPFTAGATFRQALRLRTATMEVRGGEGATAATLRLWVDAMRPAIYATVESASPVGLQAWVETWRGEDVVRAVGPERLVWSHRNETSNVAERLRLHHLEGFEKTLADPLLQRTFGGSLTATGLAVTEADGHVCLASPAPLTSARLCVSVLTAQTPARSDWEAQLAAQDQALAAVPAAVQDAAHARWWEQFWSRSWIFVSSSTPSAASAEALVTGSGKPLRIGADDQGNNGFRGHLGRVRLFTRALTPAELATLGRDRAAEPPTDGLVGDWRFEALAEAGVRDLSSANRAAAVHGTPAFATLDNMPAAHFGGTDWAEVPNAADIDAPPSFTIDAWVAPEALGEGGARILDKGIAGTGEGYVFDTFPGNSLRLIVKGNTLSYPAALAPGVWTHVAATLDAAGGTQCLYVNGLPVANARLARPVSESEGTLLTRGYVLQRFISACAGRGAYPIKFNGSLFTVDWPEKDSEGNPDARRWGPDYWHQNTRLVYWPMLAAGDWEMLQPFFRLYLDTLPLQRERTQRYFGHAGAYWPETMSFWGLSRDEDYGVAVDRQDKPISYHENPYIRWHWQGALETAFMMLDYWAWSGDDAFVASTLLPVVREVLSFYDLHYPRDAAGRLRLEPAQSLETWWECVDPLPEVAGLRGVVSRLLALPAGLVPEADRQAWQRLAKALPDVPMQQLDGRTLIAPAGQFARLGNCENPELYAIFPYRLYGVGKPDLEMARDTFAARKHPMNWGWAQDETQMALLGLTDAARRALVQRAARSYPPARFPAFWGPNFDWIPDQDHGGNLLMALQTMLLQTEGGAILLFPAWPADWDVDFRLRAPGQTVVQGTCRAGRVESLTVTPPGRRADVKVLLAAPAAP